MTLTEAAYWTRRFGVIAAAGAAVFIVLVVIIYTWPKNTTPTEYTKANYACTATKAEFLKNKLDIPTLPLGTDSDKTFEIDTETGTIDSLPRVINVYKYNNPGLLLNSQETAKELAKKLNFNPELITRRGSLENTEYIWQDATTARTLTITAKNLNLKLATDYTKPAGTLDGTLMTDDQAKSKASEILRNLGKLSEDYSKEKQDVTYLAIEPNGTYKQVTAKADAQVLRVDFIRKKSIITVRSDDPAAKSIKAELEAKGFTSETESVTTTEGKYETYNFKTLVSMIDPFKSYISVYIGPSSKSSSSSKSSTYSEVVAIDYTNWYTDPTPCGTYELTPPSVAIENLKRGNSGSLVYLREKNADTVVPYQTQSVSKFTILEVKIVYYDAPTEATFMQPIYRIKGLATLKSGISGEFYYYIPAINYDTVQDKAEDVTTTSTTK